MIQNNTDTNQLVAHFFRHNYSKMVAVLVRIFGLNNIEIAEDIVQDTLVEAMEKWSIQSIPDNPEGWLMDVAKKKTINFLRRDQLFQEKILSNLNQILNFEEHFELSISTIKDSTLRMIFTTCHPSLPVESQIALALKSLCGLSISEISNALLTNEVTINKRLYRAKQKIRENHIKFEIPNENELLERLDNVFTTLYLLFNEGYYSFHYEKLIRIDFCYEAIRLQKEVVEAFPTSFKSKALLSLMLLSFARFESRLNKNGAIVILEEQNRNLWDKGLIAEGIHYLNESIKEDIVTSYQLQAGIAAEHSVATDFKTTNWANILKQYCILEQLDNSITLQLNKSIAQFYCGYKNEALSSLLKLKTEPELQKSTLYHTTVGTFYSELKQKENATLYFEIALSLSKSLSEQELIRKKLSS